MMETRWKATVQCQSYMDLPIGVGLGRLGLESQAMLPRIGHSSPWSGKCVAAQGRLRLEEQRTILLIMGNLLPEGQNGEIE